jgi:hypothetical protein
MTNRRARLLDVGARERTFQNEITNGNYYEALQGYASLARRLVAAGDDTRIQGRDLLFRGAQQLLAAEQYAEAAELIAQLIPVCNSTTELLEVVLKLLSPILGGIGDSPALERVLEQACQHSATLFSAEHPLLEGPAARIEYPGHPTLHSMLALLAVRRGDIPKATEHFIRSDSIAAFAKLSMTWIAGGLGKGPDQSSTPPDIMFCRTVLDLCAKGNLAGANLYIAKLREAGCIATTVPLIQFSVFIPRVLERQAPALLAQLTRYYAPAFQKDSTIQSLLSTIAWVYFEEKRAARPGLQGLGNIMQSMFSALGAS